MRPLAVPHLPQAEVKLCVAQDHACAQSLTKRGITVLHPAPCGTLSVETNAHADMLLCHAGGGTVFLSADQTALSPALRNAGFTVRLVPQPGKAYPKDILLNVLIGRDFVLGNLPFADETLLAHLIQNGKRPIRVRQGYSKCSVCPVTENAFITDDPGIADALGNAEKNVLPISKGSVYLSEKHFGFFGGACGLISPDVLAVNGSLATHTDADAIRSFLKKYGVKPLELRQGPLIDIGGILPLTETDHV
ncbi:MAG: hypothetical protein IJT27_07330 [Clostridia bacterium]|nr:hypothetical protein [Clostridia bacterium]